MSDIDLEALERLAKDGADRGYYAAVPPSAILALISNYRTAQANWDLALDRAEKAEAERDRLRVALTESGKEQVFLDGYNCCVQIVDSLFLHVSWGPEATPDDGLRHALDAVREVIRRGRPVAALSPTEPAQEEGR